MPVIDPQPVSREGFETLINWAAPERAEQLRDHLSRYNPTFFLNQDKEGVLLKTGGGKIHFTHKDLRQLWLLGFVAWQAIPCYTPFIIGADRLRQPLGPAFLEHDHDLPTMEQAFDNLRYSAKQLLKADRTEDVPWPPEVPMSAADLKTVEERAVANLISMATAAMLLHELRHDKFEQDGNSA